jgi:3-oxoacyl-[acyl-carrier protein] reductase
LGLKNKRGLVTGASKGIGLAITKALAREGLKLFITARNSGELENVRRELQRFGTEIEYGVADLANPDQIEEMFNTAFDFLGGIDVLINNAGMNIQSHVIDMELSDWEQVYAVNLRAAFILSKLAGPKMIAQQSGHIINIGSGASQTPIAGHAAYCAAKHGLLGLSESMALEVREFGVKVSIILPGSTATYFGGSSPENKLSSKPGMLKPEDIADAVLYLLKQSPQAWTSIINLRPLNLGQT